MVHIQHQLAADPEVRGVLASDDPPTTDGTHLLQPCQAHPTRAHSPSPLRKECSKKKAGLYGNVIFENNDQLCTDNLS